MKKQEFLDPFITTAVGQSILGQPPRAWHELQSRRLVRVTRTIESIKEVVMFNIGKLLVGMTIKGWLVIALGFVSWVALTYLMGLYSEKKWGDRESGALIGFFVPGLLFTLVLYFI
ncbi:hypothetical protein [Candidatus Sororendozoicomonas aggregata]|uniref:hypothetical protein n=1 Tax=Candidatus Sororendozoicomonas aggregata TaxID=3073239 RepID=UPI002ED1B454